MTPALEAAPYDPHPLLRGPHRMTLAGTLLPRCVAANVPMRAGSRVIEVEPGIALLARIDEAASGDPPRGTVVLVHGLTGDAEGVALRAAASRFVSRGLRAVRLNLRGCGGSEALAPSLYHSGQSGDLLAVLRAMQREFGGDFAVGGFSLGGNLALKSMGELGDSAPSWLVGCATISAPIDLAASAALLERGGLNHVYQRHFVAGLAAELRRRAAAWPGRFDLAPLSRVHSVRQFDEAYTAPHFGFESAAAYYRSESAAPRLANIVVPTLAIHAADDPFVAPDPYVAALRRPPPALTIELEPRGGHLGFVSRGRGPGGDRRYAEFRLFSFLASRLLRGD
jgi:predicted alpha/beta-fold hydrolase